VGLPARRTSPHPVTLLLIPAVSFFNLNPGARTGLAVGGELRTVGFNHAMGRARRPVITTIVRSPPDARLDYLRGGRRPTDPGAGAPIGVAPLPGLFGMILR